MLENEMGNAHAARKPTDADRYVGQQLRNARREIGLTQDGLASLLGITFQQIQKYEAGHSRMSAGRLRDAAIALRKPIAYFYEPIDDELMDAPSGDSTVRIKDMRKQARRLVEELNSVDDLHVAVRVLTALTNN